MKETNTMNKETELQVGMMVVVNGTALCVEEVNPDGTCWGIDCDGGEMGFTTETLMSMVPE